jgi:hypothetical protein
LQGEDYSELVVVKQCTIEVVLQQEDFEQERRMASDKKSDNSGNSGASRIVAQVGKQDSAWRYHERHSSSTAMQVDMYVELRDNGRNADGRFVPEPAREEPNQGVEEAALALESGVALQAPLPP